MFIPLADRMHEDIASAFPTVRDFIQATTAAAKTLIHCETAVSRLELETSSSRTRARSLRCR